MAELEPEAATTANVGLDAEVRLTTITNTTATYIFFARTITTTPIHHLERQASYHVTLPRADFPPRTTWGVQRRPFLPVF
jgi:hypothetical protein